MKGNLIILYLLNKQFYFVVNFICKYIYNDLIICINANSTLILKLFI